MVTTLRTAPVRPAPGSVADTLAPLLELVFSGPPPVRFGRLGRQRDRARPTRRPRSDCATPTRCGACCGRPTSSASAARTSPGDLDLEGDIVDGAGRARDHAAARHPPGRGSCARPGTSPARSTSSGRHPPPPPEEAHVHGRRHSLDARRAGDLAPLRRRQRLLRDRARPVDDVLVRPVGPHDRPTSPRRRPRSTTSCAASSASRPGPGMRLLDVGCGWGSMAIHAAAQLRRQRRRHHHQRGAARRAHAARVEAAGVADRVEIRLQDYRDARRRAVRRDLVDRHVRARRARPAWPSTSPRCGRCSDPGAGCSTTRSRGSAAHGSGGARFVGRYVFPDGELHRRRRRWSAPTERGRVRGARRRVAARALRPHVARVDRQPRARLDARRGRRRRGPGARAGARTWPAPRSASTPDASRSTRRSGSSRTPTARAACRWRRDW